jgi:hypothetical protein
LWAALNRGRADVKQILFRIALFCFFLVSAQPVYSSPMVEKVKELLSLEVNQQTEQPNPFELSPNWWTYFEMEGELLSERVILYEKFLNNLLAEVPIEKKVDAEILIKKIIFNLRFPSISK